MARIGKKSVKAKSRKPLIVRELAAWFRYVDSLPIPEDAKPIDVLRAVRGHYDLPNMACGSEWANAKR